MKYIVFSPNETAQLIAGKIASNVKSTNKACLLMASYTLALGSVYNIIHVLCRHGNDSFYICIIIHVHTYTFIVCDHCTLLYSL